MHGQVARGRDLKTLLFRTSPLLTAAIGPLLMIGLAALGVLPLVTALYLAAAVDLALMFVWGFGLGRRMGAGLLAALLSGLVNLLIGLMVVGVKLVAGHQLVPYPDRRRGQPADVAIERSPGMTPEHAPRSATIDAMTGVTGVTVELTPDRGRTT
ncbi:hypothetical protein PHK61_24240 [Actinomycetospora lutea]|uniref:hypothetical protein n=1 Tax=Actinomycetospora lutea TaxID=663604 RepID=UPI0023673058|nr:hypothetical protein [Actinomycetospora lutea]MDD7941535.1 hypothetical protein [Actinomycetospora lutea]